MSFGCVRNAPPNYSKMERAKIKINAWKVEMTTAL